jgi:cytochrome c oxidase subunit 2
MDVNFQLFPEQASTLAPRIDAVFWYVFSVSLFFTLLIATLIIVFAIRYRRRAEDYYPRPIIGSKVLETVWIVVPLVLALVMFFWGARVFFDIERPPDGALEVYVVGKQWMWHLQHADGGQREINELHIPVGRPVKLIMTSEDVIHAFFVPAFRTKQDVIPGRYTYSWFEATRVGTYHLFCAEYCGTNHSRMIGRVVAMEPIEYERWLSRRADRSLALQGRQLFQKLQCVTCHSATSTGRAPVLEGLYRRRVTLETGRTVLADESYLRESILYPRAKIVAGYRPIMPSFKGQVSEDDLIRLIAFLKALGPGETPDRVEESRPPEAEDGEAKKKPEAPARKPDAPAR